MSGRGGGNKELQDPAAKQTKNKNHPNTGTHVMATMKGITVSSGTGPSAFHPSGIKVRLNSTVRPGMVTAAATATARATTDRPAR